MCKRGGEEETAADRNGNEGELGAGVQGIKATNGGGDRVQVPRDTIDGDGRRLAGGGWEYTEGAEKLGTTGKDTG